jgi:hypothetical protein
MDDQLKIAESLVPPSQNSLAFLMKVLEIFSNEILIILLSNTKVFISECQDLIKTVNI